MSNKKIHITHLYRNEMNIYGDNGNVLGLTWRLQRRGYEPVVEAIGVGEDIPHDTDIIVSGGGQDSGQMKVQEDLQTKARTLQSMRDDGVVMLAVCGMYQLMGHYFQTSQGDKIPGAGVLNVTTIAGTERLIGNIRLQTEEFGQLIGFENHSGETTLGDGVDPLGTVVLGAGNTASADVEGAVSHNVFATYLHGPIVPKNPVFADALLVRALSRKYGDVQLEHIDDSLAQAAAKIHSQRPR